MRITQPAILLLILAILACDDPGKKECADLAPDECESDRGTCMSISGRSCLEHGDCPVQGAAYHYECVALRGCDEAITYARDPDGRLWVFGDGCIPEGWHEGGG